jgi:hypothetical protein
MPARKPKKRKPHLALERVQKLIKLAVIGETVVTRAWEDSGEEDIFSADRFIRELILVLTPNDFAYSEPQVYSDSTHDADIYAVENHFDVNWYIKFYEKHGRITVTSCHALEYDIRLANGKVIRGQK